MSLLSGLGKTLGEGHLFGKVLESGKIGRAVEKMAKPSSLMAIGTGAFALGMFNKAAPAARDALFDMSMGDPNADVAFTGRKFSPTFLAGNYAGGFAKTMGNMVNPIDYASTGAPVAQGINFMGSAAGLATGAGFTAAGGAVGGYSGYKLAKLAKKGPVAAAFAGAAGVALGAGLTGAATLSAGPASVIGHIKSNKRFYTESPYAGNSSLSNALALNASGDIVLGMHNSRRGY